MLAKMEANFVASGQLLQKYEAEDPIHKPRIGLTRTDKATTGHLFAESGFGVAQAANRRQVIQG